MTTASKQRNKERRKSRRYERKLQSLPANASASERLRIQRLLASCNRRIVKLECSLPANLSNNVIRLIPRLGPPHPDYRKDEGFYQSDSWRKLRYLALKNCKGCECCGAKASDGVRIHVDHIKPRYKHPHLSLELSNLQCLCEDCNLGKGAWDDTDWRIKM